MSRLLKLLEEETRGWSQFDIIKAIGNILDKHREVSIQEAIYRLLGLPMSKFSTRVKYINTNHPEIREGLLRSNYKELPEGEPIFHLSPHHYYELRPTESVDGIDFEDMCLADFVANFEIKKSEVANSIPLLDNKSFIVKRSKPAVLRYYLKFDEPEDLARGLLILFLPFRDEIRDIHEQNVMDLLHENKDSIEENCLVYEKNMNLVELIQDIEAMQEEGDEGNLEENLEDPLREEEELDELIETTSEKDIDKFLKSVKASAKREIKTNSDVQIPSVVSLREKIILLNVGQRKIYDDICERLMDINGGCGQFCLYIDGPAGAGKSFLLKLLIDSMRYLLMESGDEIEMPKVLIMAPTANAATIIQGKTIESCLAINPHERWNFVKASEERQSQLKFLYQNVRVLVCDDISMVNKNQYIDLEKLR